MNALLKLDFLERVQDNEYQRIIQDIKGVDYVGALYNSLCDILEIPLIENTKRCRVIFEYYNKDKYKPNNDEVYKEIKHICRVLIAWMKNSDRHTLIFGTIIQRITHIKENIETFVADDLSDAVIKLTDFLNKNFIDEKIRNKFTKLIKELNKVVFEHGELLGKYVKGYPENDFIDTIYLYLETIDKEAKLKCVDVVKLTETVFIHEYTHHLHLYDIYGDLHGLLKKNNITKVVKETVAETVAYLFSRNVGLEIKNWQENHIKAGTFPWWPYAGASKLITKPENEIIDILNKIIKKSKSNFQKAFEIIENL